MPNSTSQKSSCSYKKFEVTGERKASKIICVNICAVALRHCLTTSVAILESTKLTRAHFLSFWKRKAISFYLFASFFSETFPPHPHVACWKFRMDRDTKVWANAVIFFSFAALKDTREGECKKVNPKWASFNITRMFQRTIASTHARMHQTCMWVSFAGNSWHETAVFKGAKMNIYHAELELFFCQMKN